MNRHEDDGPRLPDPRMIPQRGITPWRPEAVEHAAPKPRVDNIVEETVRDTATFDDAVVRPFVMTGGRTMPLTDGLRIETMVLALPSALSAPLQLEQRAVVRLCQKPQSIAEVSAALKVPIGVVKVIVGDLVTEGYLSAGEVDLAEIAALERIRDLVRSL